MPDIHPRVIAALRLASPEARIGVALSGGADSTLALLKTLEIVAPEKIVALHFHHGVRGEEADGDERHVIEFCRRLDVSLRLGRREDDTPPSEENLRRARLAFFRSHATESDLCAIITGHHADDVAETMILRLARGSGAAGLAAPRPVSRAPGGLLFLRPLLAFTKTEILAELRKRGEGWREDSTNNDPSFASRNALRALLIPLRQAIAGHDLVRGARRTRELLEEDDAALELWATEAESLLSAHADTARKPFSAFPRAVLRRALHRRLLRIRPQHTIGATEFDRLLDAVAADRPHRIRSAGETLLFDGRTLSGRPKEFAPLTEAVLPLPGAVFWPCGATLVAEASVARASSPDTLTLPAGFATRHLRAGSRKPGERYRPHGAPGSAKIQDMMVNRKIPRLLRNALPVIADETGPLWAPGLIPSERLSKTAPGAPAFRLTWTPPAAP